MENIDSEITNVINKLHDQFNQTVRSMSPEKKRDAYQKLENVFKDSIKKKLSYWSEVEYGQHVEGVTKIYNDHDTPHFKR